MARRFLSFIEPSLQKLWECCHLTELERELRENKLPMRCNAIWFHSTFLRADAPTRLTSTDKVWPYFRGFIEYDGLTMVVATIAAHPELFNTLFQPYECPTTSSIVVGRSEAEPGIRNGRQVSTVMLHLFNTSIQRAIPPELVHSFRS